MRIRFYLFSVYSSLPFQERPRPHFAHLNRFRPCTRKHKNDLKSSIVDGSMRI